MDLLVKFWKKKETLGNVCLICFHSLQCEDFDSDAALVQCVGPRGCTFHRNCAEVILNHHNQSRPHEAGPRCPCCGIVW